MTIMEWNDRLDIGVELLDNAHKKLFSIMRRMAKLNENPANYKLICQEGIKYFNNYTLQHFAEEEEYMRSIHYENYETHKRLHDNMRQRTLPALEQEVEEAGYSVESVQHFMGIFMAWLTQHIMTEDRAIAGKVSSRQRSIRPKDEIHALGESMIQTVQTILGFQTQIVSECYHGENVGEMYFFRLHYITGSGAPLMAYLGFEDKLILAAASEMMGAPVKKISNMSLTEIRLLSKSIMRSLGQQFSYVDSCTLKKDSMLSYELLLKAFQDGYPPVSMLFRTSEGYLVFCVQT